MEIELDHISLKFFLQNYRKLDVLSRAQVFVCVYKMIFTLEVGMGEFFDWIEQELIYEECEQLFSQYLIYTGKLIDDYLSPQDQNKFGPKIFNTLYKMLCTRCRDEIKDKPDSFYHERVKIIKDNIMSFAKSPESIITMYGWHEHQDLLLKHESVTSTIRGHLFETILLRQMLTETERKQIVNMYLLGNRYYSKLVEGVSADFAGKLKFWKHLLRGSNSKENSFMVTSYFMKGFNNPFDEKSVQYFESRFFEDLIDVFLNNNLEYSKLFFNKLFPPCNNYAVYIEKLNEIKNLKEFPQLLEDIVEERLHKLQLKLKIYESLK